MLCRVSRYSSNNREDSGDWGRGQIKLSTYDEKFVNTMVDMFKNGTFIPGNKKKKFRELTGKELSEY